MTHLILQTENLGKNYGPKSAVTAVNLALSAGEIYALIGPNGAGKTTLLKMIVGLLSPSSGQAVISGHNIVSSAVEAKRTLGYVSDNPVVYDYLTGLEFLHLTGSLRALKPEAVQQRLEEILDLFPLTEILNQKMGSYSRGNRQKIAFLAAILAKPRLLVIDEPIAGLDPTSITTFGTTLKHFAAGGGTVLIATHILSFAQLYADRVGVMNDGKLIREEPVSSSLEKVYADTLKTSSH